MPLRRPQNGCYGAGSSPLAPKALKNAESLLTTFLERLATYRVLDPACGSGNFLYLALLALKDIEHRANFEGEALGLPRGFPRIGPECVLGIEINSFAAELARVSVWIGEIQWMRRNGFEAAQNPILKPLTNIECRDALLDTDGASASWPKADAVIGNPPFLGSKFMRNGRPATRTAPAVSGLGDAYVDLLHAAYRGTAPASANLVSYWFAQLARQIGMVDPAPAIRVGLVATKTIARGSSNKPLAALAALPGMRITNAVTDMRWEIDGAEVRVALLCLSNADPNTGTRLDDADIDLVNADLTTGIDVSLAGPRPENRGLCFQGVKQNGTFTVPAVQARAMLLAPTNPNGQRNGDVVRRFHGNDDVTMRTGNEWIIDFTDVPAQADAALYEGPFEAVRQVERERADRAKGAATETGKLARFWLMQRPRPDLRAAAAGLDRVLAVPESSEHLIFRWLPARATFSGSLFVFARDDDTFAGILQSRFHQAWALRRGNKLGVGNQPRYNKGTTFETFPFPKGLTPDIPAADYAGDPRAQAVAGAARELNEKREAWLNPPDLVDRVPEVVEGYPDRLIPKDEAAAKELKKRTLTNLYNARPAWLAGLHARLDAAVAAAYGWDAEWQAGMDDEAILARLFALNRERSG